MNLSIAKIYDVEWHDHEPSGRLYDLITRVSISYGRALLDDRVAKEMRRHGLSGQRVGKVTFATFHLRNESRVGYGRFRRRTGLDRVASTRPQLTRLGCFNSVAGDGKLRAWVIYR